MAMEPKEASRAAERIFIRVTLHDLMVDLCMRADDPKADADLRSTRGIGVADGMLGGDEGVRQFALLEFDSFWEAVEKEVATRISGREQKG